MTPGEKFSHHSCRDLTRNLLITSPALQPLSYFCAYHFLYYYFSILNSLFDKLNVCTVLPIEILSEGQMTPCQKIWVSNSLNTDVAYLNIQQQVFLY